MRSARRRLSVLLALSFVATAVPAQVAAQPPASARCLDIEPEVFPGRTGSPTYLVATLRKKTSGTTACNGPMVEKGSARLIDFELTGVNDPEGTGVGSDSPESPDATCQISPEYYVEARCVVGVWGDQEGIQTVRAWIDEDAEDPPEGIVEADRTEGADKTAEPGDGCVSSDPLELPDEEEPDCTDVVEIDWRDRPACETTSEPLGPFGRVAVRRDGEGVEPGLFTIDHRGGRPRRLGAPEDLRDFLWSPDRRKLVITTGYINNLELSVIRADGSRLTQLTDDFQLDEGAAWSPDSRRIVYASSNYRKNTPIQLKVVSATGGERKLLTRGRFDSTEPDWAPDGERIVYARYDIGQPTVAQLATIDPDGSNRRTLLKGKKTLFEYPQYSPDGRQILFRKMVRRTDSRDLFVLNVGGRLERLTDAGFVSDFQWSPDGSKVVYETYSDTGWRELRVVRADGSRDHTIARHFGLDVWFAPSWSPDSSLVAYQLNYRPYDPDTSRHLSDVWVSSADGR
jgi:Tol biopolymer transport system component